ncbi:MAG: PIN domain-containing protein [Acidimicrobiales bacterium]
MRLVVDTGVFSAAISPRRRASFDDLISALAGNQLLLTAQTVAELRFGVLVAKWGEPRRGRLEAAIATTTVIPVTDALITQVAALRHACQIEGHPLANSAHANDLWIEASTMHVRARLVTADRVFEDVPGLQRLVAPQ